MILILIILLAFKYKTKIIVNTYNVDSTIPNPAGAGRIVNLNYNLDDSGKKNVESAIPLKYLGNIWRALNMPLISCEVSLELKWNKNCLMTSQQTGINLDRANTAAPTGATLAINDSKLYIPVVTLSKDDEIKLLTHLKSGFTREIEWNKYRSQMTTEAINNNLSILIDSTFTNVNRLFDLAYQTADNDNHFLNFIYQKLWLKILMLLLIS